MNPAAFGKVAVLMGGMSAEREVSLKSGAQVLEALQAAGIDAVAIDAGRDVMDRLRRVGAERAFIVLHGPWGEDGVVQGALETIGMPYTGSRVLGSALAMDKLRTKQIWSCLGLPTPEYAVIRHADELLGVLERHALPLFVKPGAEGSSIGVTKVESPEQLRGAFDTAARFGGPVLAESFIGGPEVTISILGDDALPIIKLETPRTFYDYEAKYQSDTTGYLCPCGLDDELESSLQSLALEAFRALDCTGWGRVDLMLDSRMNPYLLEANTIPGMTDHSLVPMAAREVGLSFPELVTKILETSL
ncbi:MAG: D-alanine--D-alanine ligase [Gammaproteobacteria bacterium]|nr:D-alanine--D-alanine ligase [Gammaproteobacteria bacterium]